jgi:hypothetical protein
MQTETINRKIQQDNIHTKTHIQNWSCVHV